MRYFSGRAVTGMILVWTIAVSACFAKTIEVIGRECQTGKAKACDEILRIAATAKNPKDRLTAIPFISDISTLSAIADQSPNSDEKLAAGAELIKIATMAKNPKDRLEAISFISDSSVLSAIANDATQEREVSLAARARVTALNKQEAEQPARLAEQERLEAQAIKEGKPYVKYPDGFVLPVGARVNPSNFIEVNNYFIKHPGKIFHASVRGVWPVQGFTGFHGSVLVAGAEYEVGGFAVILPDAQHGSTLEYAFVDTNCIILYAPNGRGVLTLIVGTTEWLLPGFDLGAASSSKGYVYSGPFIEN